MADNSKDARLADLQRRAEAMGKNRVGAGQFIQEAISELQKTSWPNNAVLMKSITVVLALVVAVGVWVFGIEELSGRVMGFLFGH